MEHLIPTGALARYVAEICVWPAVAADVVRSVERLPDGSAGLVFRASGAGRSEADLCATGPVSQAHYKRKTVTTLTVAVKFHAGGAYPFFGVPLHSLTDEIVPLEQLWGCAGAAGSRAPVGSGERAGAGSSGGGNSLAAAAGRPGSGALLGGPGGARRTKTRERCGSEQRARAGPPSGDERAAAPALLQHRGGHRPQRVPADAALPAGRRDRWPDRGTGRRGGGYYDQAHLISEFQRLARMTPRAFANRHARTAAGA